jgi:hypothetical protein
MACKLQNPRVKVNHAILIAGYQGSGKDTFWAPFLWSVCGQGRNLGELNNNTINSQWGYAYESEVIMLHELRESEAKDRRALANHLKPIIAAPPATILVNKKIAAPLQRGEPLPGDRVLERPGADRPRHPGSPLDVRVV